jgi:hypothetical protein
MYITSDTVHCQWTIYNVSGPGSVSITRCMVGEDHTQLGPLEGASPHHTSTDNVKHNILLIIFFLEIVHCLMCMCVYIYTFMKY